MTVEMPPRVQAHLGIGEAPCWIIADEINRFTWPGPDIRPVRRGDQVSLRYGSIPGKLFEQLRRLVDEVARKGQLKVTKRTE